MEEYLVNQTITKVYKGKSGQGEYGPWIAWNFNIEGDDRKFSYFSGGKKPEPYEGAFIKLAKFEKVVKGQYTNYNVKELVFDTQNNETRQEPDQGPPGDYEPPGEKDGYVDKPAVKQSLTPQSSSEKLSFYVSYAKDIQTSLIMTGNIQESATLKELGNEVMEVGIEMWKRATNKETPF